MKKILFLALLVLSISCTAHAAMRDSTMLANGNTLNSNVRRSEGTTPLGAVMTWPYPDLPADGKWVECKGQSIRGTALCSELGRCTAPDYRGKFLRGVGGNSAALGEVQGDAVRTLTGDSIVGGFESGDNVYNPTGVFKVHDLHYGGGNSNGKDGGWRPRVELDIAGMLPLGNEVRPVNIAVKYIIKVN